MSRQPLLNCHFIVEWGGERLDFMEVSGLAIEYDVIPYRSGSSPETKYTNIPGLRANHNLVLKRAITPGNNAFYEWINTVGLNRVERRDLRISLLNEAHEPVMTWTVKDAWPVKYEGPALHSLNSMPAMETLEITHEGISVQVD